MRRNTIAIFATVLALAWRGASGQTVTVVHNVNLRPDPSTEYPPIRLLTPSEPPLALLEPVPESGYYHVKTSAGAEGYVWSRGWLPRLPRPRTRSSLAPASTGQRAWPGVATACGSTYTIRRG